MKQGKTEEFLLKERLYKILLYLSITKKITLPPPPPPIFIKQFDDEKGGSLFKSRFEIPFLQIIVYFLFSSDIKTFDIKQ